MIDIGVVVTAVLGTITTIFGTWGSWYITREKYQSEVDNNLIGNMQKSLEFYNKLLDDNNVRLEEVLTRNKELEEKSRKLEEEVKKLREQVNQMMATMCIEPQCVTRKPLNNI